MALQHQDPDALDVATLVTQATWPTLRTWDDEAWVERVPAAFVEALAGLADDEAPQVAHRWLRSEQMRYDWGAEDTSWVGAYVRDLTQLAQQAIASGKALFLWVSL